MIIVSEINIWDNTSLSPLVSYCRSRFGVAFTCFEISSGDHKAAAAAAHGRQSVRATGRCLRCLCISSCIQNHENTTQYKSKKRG